MGIFNSNLRDIIHAWHQIINNDKTHVASIENFLYSQTVRMKQYKSQVTFCIRNFPELFGLTRGFWNARVFTSILRCNLVLEAFLAGWPGFTGIWPHHGLKLCSNLGQRDWWCMASCFLWCVDCSYKLNMQHIRKLVKILQKHLHVSETFSNIFLHSWARCTMHMTPRLLFHTQPSLMSMIATLSQTNALHGNAPNHWNTDADKNHHCTMSCDLWWTSPGTV